MEKIITVIITENPPAESWCFGMKGRIFKVVDQGTYYLLHEDIDKDEYARCIPKFAAEEF